MKISKDYDPMNEDFTINISGKGLDLSFEFNDRMSAETLAFLLESSNLRSVFAQQSYLKTKE